MKNLTQGFLPPWFSLLSTIHLPRKDNRDISATSDIVPRPVTRNFSLSDAINRPPSAPCPSYTLPDIFRYSITATQDIAGERGRACRKNVINRRRGRDAYRRHGLSPGIFVSTRAPFAYACSHTRVRAGSISLGYTCISIARSRNAACG